MTFSNSSKVESMNNTRSPNRVMSEKQELNLVRNKKRKHDRSNRAAKQNWSS